MVGCDLDVITDDELRQLLLPLKVKDVSFTMIADCCHSGTLLDDPDVLISGCKFTGSANTNMGSGAAAMQVGMGVVGSVCG